MKDVYEELIRTIEGNAVDNVATITNVKLWAESWRRERGEQERMSADELADEAWRMLTDKAKEEMLPIKESYIASISADIAHRLAADDDLKRLYEWLMSENREPAQTKFTQGELRNVAKEIEYRLAAMEKEKKKTEQAQQECNHEWKVEAFDRMGFPIEQYCDKCDKIEPC